jgi:hypothetical protein
LTQVDGESEDKEPLNALPSVGWGALNHELDGCEEKIVSYITHVLQPGETIRYQGSVRWILYLQALLLALVGAVASLLGPPWGWVASAIPPIERAG